MSELMDTMVNRLDIDFSRGQFPAFKDPLVNEWVFFENAAGSYVAGSVIERLNHYLISTRVQPGSFHELSVEAGKAVDNSYKLFSEALNVEYDEVIFNHSTSMNLYILANSFRKELKSGDEIIVTNQDHESNIGFWYRLADIGANIKEWKVSPDTGLLSINDLKKLLNTKTKIVCCSHCSNVVADIQDIKSIANLVHNVGGVLVVDGVSYAPHGSLNIEELDVDFYAYSLYKTYGPHLALMYGKREHLEKMNNQGHYFNGKILRKKWSPSGPPYEGIAAAAGVIDYYLAVHDHHFDPSSGLPLHIKLKQVHDLFHEHEVALCEPIFDFLKSHPKVRILGSKEMTPHKRGPNISFVHSDIPSKKIVKGLASHKIAATNYHFYAKRLLEAIGIKDPNDGAVRFSLVHYNTHEEVKKLLEVLPLVL